MVGHWMQERRIMASTFKARCLALLDQVGIDRVPIVITKRGRPIAKVVPMDEASGGRTVMGSVRLVAESDAAYYTTDESWEADG
jgi:prevent-host-death family protein